MQTYARHCEAIQQPPDAALNALMSFLILYLDPVHAELVQRRRLRRAAAAVAALAGAAGALLARGRR